MKRVRGLQPLSRDHHQALFVAQRLRRAEEPDVEARALEFLDFWRNHGKGHFRVEKHVRHEERVLFPRIEQALPAPELESLARAMERAESDS